MNPGTKVKFNRIYIEHAVSMLRAGIDEDLLERAENAFSSWPRVEYLKDTLCDVLEEQGLMDEEDADYLLEERRRLCVELAEWAEKCRCIEPSVRASGSLVMHCRCDVGTTLREIEDNIDDVEWRLLVLGVPQDRWDEHPRTLGQIVPPPLDKLSRGSQNNPNGRKDLEDDDRGTACEGPAGPCGP